MFRNYIDSFMIVLIDDIFIYTNSEYDHIIHLRIVLQVLKDHQLFPKFIKCEYWQRSIVFLGHVVSSVGIEFDLKENKGG